MIFEWDENKNKSNIQKQGLDFEDAKRLFTNGTLRSTIDDRIDYGEVRYVGVGQINDRLMSVVYTERSPNIIRIISFRKINTREVKKHENSIKD